jgi:hypothetical protein
MKHNNPESDEEELMLQLLKRIMGGDAVHFGYKGGEVVEFMTMAYKEGRDAGKETK